MTSMQVLEEEAEIFHQVCVHSEITIPQMDVRVVGSQGLVVNSQEVVNLLGYNYLPNVVLGVSLSSPVVGLLDETKVLMEALARFHRTGDAVLFSSGYIANRAVLRFLARRLRSPTVAMLVRKHLHEKTLPTTFFVQKGGVHYSLLDGLDENRRVFFATASELAQMLRDGQDGVRIIITDAVSSVTGQVFNIGGLVRIAEEYGCIVVVDESHSIGVLGEGGRGVSAGLPKENLFLTASMSKGIGSAGGYVTVPSRLLAQFFRFASPEYLFSSQGFAHHSLEALRSLELIQSLDGEEARRTISLISNTLRAELRARGYQTDGDSHIIPIMVGDEGKAQMVRKKLLQVGFVVSAFHFPAVPRRKAILRVSINSGVTNEQVRGFLSALDAIRATHPF